MPRVDVHRVDPCAPPHELERAVEAPVVDTAARLAREHERRPARDRHLTSRNQSAVALPRVDRDRPRPGGPCEVAATPQRDAAGANVLNGSECDAALPALEQDGHGGRGGERSDRRARVVVGEDLLVTVAVLGEAFCSHLAHTDAMSIAGAVDDERRRPLGRARAEE